MIRGKLIIRLLFFLIVVSLIRLTVVEDKQYFVLSGIINIIFFTWFLWRDVKEIKCLHLGQLYLVGNVFLLGIGPLYLSSVMGTDRGFEVLEVGGLLPVEYFPEGVFLIQLSTMFFLMGYYWIKAKPKNLAKPYQYEPFVIPSDFAIWLFVLFSLGVRIYDVLPGVLGYAFIMVPIAATYVFTVKFFKEPSKKLLHFFCIAVLMLSGLYFMGNAPLREQNIMIIFPILVGTTVILLDRWQIDRFRKVKRSHLAIGIACALLVLIIIYVVFPATTLMKLEHSPNLKSAVIAILTDEEARSAVSEARESRATAPLVSGSIAVKFRHESVAIDYNPLMRIASGFIPRWLWPKKPIIAPGAWFYKFITDYQGLPRGEGANMAITATGELFWAYGWVGFILGMLGYGLVVAWINQTFFKKDLRNLFGIALVLLAMMRCLKALEEGFSYPMSLMLVLSILAYITSKFIFGRTSRVIFNKHKQ